MRKDVKIFGWSSFLIFVLLLGLRPYIIDSPESNSASLVTRESKSIRVLLVAGHGDINNSEYQTPGKQSPTWPDGLKIHEGVSNLNMAYQLAYKLSDAGYDTQIINPDPEDMSLYERVYKVNYKHALDPRCVAIFLHHNAQPNQNNTADYIDPEGLFGWTSISTGGATGIEIFTSPGHTGSDDIADCIAREIRSDCNLKYRGTKEANFYVLRKTTTRSILIEYGFMTTYSPDCLVINDPTSREVYCDAIIKGLDKYLKL